MFLNALIKRPSGIAFAGSVYHLLGREPLEGAESVMLEEVDAGKGFVRGMILHLRLFTRMPMASNRRTISRITAFSCSTSTAVSCYLFRRWTMFRITKNGASVGMTEAPTYIKQHNNGSFVLCPEPEASGIAFAGSVYHLLGREPLEGAESVMLEEVDARPVRYVPERTYKAPRHTCGFVPPCT